MSKDERAPIDVNLRGFASKLEQRRSRILRAQRTFQSLADAYATVITDLRSASGEMRADEPVGG